MTQQERWIWVGGWGLEPGWLGALLARCLPDADHTVIPPCPRLVEQIDWTSYDRAGGYSLGAFLLLRPDSLPPLPTLLLAPFFAFPSEAGLGGKISQRDLRYMSSLIRRYPVKAFEKFYLTAGLTLEIKADLPYPLETLQSGLDALASEQVPSVLPDNCLGYVGELDPLVNTDSLLSLDPRLCEVKGADHHPEALLKAAIARS